MPVFVSYLLKSFVQRNVLHEVNETFQEAAEFYLLHILLINRECGRDEIDNPLM